MIFASNNAGKLREIRKILNDYNIYSLKDKNIEINVEEDQDTFEGNAKKKAKEIYNLTHEETIADDSGLCIDALGGMPGVYTHRFLGANMSDEYRNQFLIDAIKDHEDKSAKVVCSLVYYDGKEYVVGTGILNGHISSSRRGDNGFGFDEIFELDNNKTLAELSQEEKNEISARGLAAKELKKKLQK